MRPVYFYGAISLDGYLSDNHDNLQWLFDTDLNQQSTYEAFERQVDTVVMGRVTYQETLKILGDEPLYPDKEKIILSRHQAGQVDGGRYENTDPVTLVRQLRQQSGKAIWIVGGGAIVSALTAAHLIDEYWIQIAPVLLGRGKRLFEPNDDEQRLTLVDTTVMGELTELHFKKQN